MRASRFDCRGGSRTDHHCPSVRSRSLPAAGDHPRTDARASSHSDSDSGRTATAGAQAQAAPQPRTTPTGAAAEQASTGGDVALRGRQLFFDYSCGTCHSLAAAGATGAIGPSLDHNPRLTEAFVRDVITHGSGAMPSFGGVMSEEEIDTLTRYVIQAAKK